MTPMAMTVAPWRMPERRRRPGHTDAIADQDTPAAPAAAANHAAGADRAHDRGRPFGVAERLGQSDREQGLERDRREAPEQLDRDEREQDP